MSETRHIAVMTAEVINVLQPRSGGRYIDATLGGGTHTRELLKASAPDGHVLSLDVDREALDRAKRTFAEYGKRWTGFEGNFRRIAEIASECGFDACDGILLDLGLSSDELEDPAKGISFRIDGPLDMRLGPKANEDGLTAASIINSWKESDIASIIRDYGEERLARRIASAIVSARKNERIVRTFQLADIIRAAVPKGYERGRIDPATRTFQALRIAVNDELGALKEAIEGATTILAPGGRIAIISFHSLEDRIVKQAFKSSEMLSATTKKPIIPGDKEIAGNPRSRSAKLRIAEKEVSSTSKKSKQQKQKYVPRVRHVNNPTT